MARSKNDRSIGAFANGVPWTGLQMLKAPAGILLESWSFEADAAFAGGQSGVRGSWWVLPAPDPERCAGPCH